MGASAYTGRGFPGDGPVAVRLRVIEAAPGVDLYLWDPRDLGDRCWATPIPLPRLPFWATRADGRRAVEQAWEWIPRRLPIDLAGHSRPLGFLGFHAWAAGLLFLREHWRPDGGPLDVDLAAFRAGDAAAGARLLGLIERHGMKQFQANNTWAPYDDPAHGVPMLPIFAHLVGDMSFRPYPMPRAERDSGVFVHRPSRQRCAALLREVVVPLGDQPVLRACWRWSNDGMASLPSPVPWREGPDAMPVGEWSLDPWPATHLRARALLRVPTAAEAVGLAPCDEPPHPTLALPALVRDAREPIELPSTLPVIAEPAAGLWLVTRTHEGMLLPRADPRRLAYGDLAETPGWAVVAAPSRPGAAVENHGKFLNKRASGKSPRKGAR